MCKDTRDSLPRRAGDVRGPVQCGCGHHQAAGGYEVNLQKSEKSQFLYFVLIMTDVEPTEAPHATFTISITTVP